MSYELKLGKLTQVQRDQLELEDALEDEMGPRPVLLPGDELIWDLFWRLRRGTPADQPIGPDRVLLVADRLYGPLEPEALLTQIEAMDGAYVRFHAPKPPSPDGSGLREGQR